ncbi:MAG TPA: glycosyltransferase family 2 protein [Methylomirabilota bacterium]|jgi:glycosyltransferase involved in cell wall biosynthesis|nr:glycosyltransferase family 2 protein [Methylomirabilota bacterium]
MKVTLIIPALDEAAVIGDVVRRVPRAAIGEVIVVDNGSTDATAGVATRAGARVVVEARRGYGAACWAGVQALGPDVDVAAFLDGDGSQRPEELPRVLAPVLRGEADLVLGARGRSGHHPLHAVVGTRLVAGFVALRYGVRLTDLGPFRAIRVELLRRLGMRDRGFGWPVEMVVKAAALRARIAEVEVTQAPRAGGRSKVSGTVTGSVRAGCAFLSTAVRAARDVS